MILRENYIQKLLEFKDTKTIKVITGMRRCGKSALMLLYKDHLINEGISESQIVHMNFESLKYEEYNDYKTLYTYIESLIQPECKMYLLLDEIQQVQGWEKAVNSLTIDYDVDLYLTGSNAYLLSSELATYLSGRYIEIKMLPLSFKEYLVFVKALRPNDQNESIEFLFERYLKYGSLPLLFEHKNVDIVFDTLLLGVYNTVLVKDVLERNKITDVKLFNDVVRFALDNIGNLTSSKKVSDFLSSDGKKTTHNTVLNYFSMLENAFILYSARRYDIKGKQYLKTLDKYYVVDTGIRNAVLGLRNADYGHILENIVYLELRRRGFDVSIGVYRDYEIDFVASNSQEKFYVQVTQSLKEEAVYNREIRALEAIDDNYPKIILSMDRTFRSDYKGIQFKYILDFLLEE